MSRKWPEIYQSMIDEKDNQPALNGLLPSMDNSQDLLDDLQSTSKVARWRLDFFVASVMMSVSEGLIELAASQKEPGLIHWYYQKVLEFQYGDGLVLINGKYEYPVVNPANRIIALAAVVETASKRLIIKVAKAGPVPLSALEMAAFQAYVDAFRFAGVKIIIVSKVADTLKLGAEIFYDPQVIAPDGSLLSDSATFPVENAINTFITNLPFNGRLELQKLIDIIQSVPGVRNVVVGQFMAKYGLIPYINLMLEAGQAYVPDAGYLKVSVVPGETLTDLLNYQAYV